MGCEEIQSVHLAEAPQYKPKFMMDSHLVRDQLSIRKASAMAMQYSADLYG
jgi:hypothetical protein